MTLNNSQVMKGQLHGGAPKRPRGDIDMVPKADDPAIVRNTLAFRSMTFEDYQTSMGVPAFRAFKDFVLKARHGDRVLEFCITNPPASKQIEEST